MTIKAGSNGRVFEGPILRNVHADAVASTDHGIAAEFPLIEVRQCELGRGVFLTKDVKAEKQLLQFRGSVLTFDEQFELPDEANSLQFGRDLFIDTQAPGVYVNHSCEPNCYVNAGLWLKACCDLKAGEQLTFDYSTTMLERNWQMHSCQCGAKTCRHTIKDFDLLPVEVQHRYIENGWAMPHVLYSPGLVLSVCLSAEGLAELPVMRRYRATGSVNPSGL